MILHPDGCCSCGRTTRALTREGWCPPCERSFKAQFDIGYALLLDYLAHHAAFQDWCAAHGAAA